MARVRVGDGRLMEKPRNAGRKQPNEQGLGLPAVVTRPRLTFGVDPRSNNYFFRHHTAPRARDIFFFSLAVAFLYLSLSQTFALFCCTSRLLDSAPTYLRPAPAAPLRGSRIAPHLDHLLLDLVLGHLKRLAAQLYNRLCCIQRRRGAPKVKSSILLSVAAQSSTVSQRIAIHFAPSLNINLARPRTPTTSRTRVSGGITSGGTPLSSLSFLSWARHDLHLTASRHHSLVKLSCSSTARPRIPPRIRQQLLQAA